MEILINIISFIVSFIVVYIASANLTLTLFKQIPFTNKLKASGIISGNRRFLLYAIRIIIALAVIVVALVIPVVGVKFGAIAGMVFTLRGLFDARGRNDMLVDFVRNAQTEYVITDQEKWDILAEAVMGIKELEDFIKRGSQKDLHIAFSQYQLSEENKRLYEELTKQGNEHRQRTIEILATMRDELLSHNSSLWIDIYDKHTTKTEFEEMHRLVQRTTQKQKLLLHGESE